MGEDDNPNLHSQYLGLLQTFGTVLDDVVSQNFSPFDKKGELAKKLDGCLLRLELWGDDIDFKDGTLDSVAMSPLAETVHRLLNSIQRDIVKAKSAVPASEQGADTPRDAVSTLQDSLTEALDQLLELAHPIQAIHGLRTGRGLYGKVAVPEERNVADFPEWQKLIQPRLTISSRSSSPRTVISSGPVSTAPTSPSWEARSPSSQVLRMVMGDPKRPGRLIGRSYPNFPDVYNPQRVRENLHILQHGLLLPKGTYTYTPIAPNEIRLLHLLPAGDKSDMINCMLKVARLDDLDLQYEALSYTWGYEEPTQEMRIQRGGMGLKDFGRAVLEHKTFYIRPNLDDALRYLRDYSDEARTEVLWVDAICINQNDENEKSIQVAKMAEIYRGAENIFIWLGKESEDSSMGMNFVGHILNVEQQGELSVKASTPQQWSAFMALMRREWFSRRWVVQELALARRAFLICGESAVDWNDFVAATEFFLDRLDDITALYSNSPEFKQKLLSLGDLRAFGAGKMISVTNDFVSRAGDNNIERLKSLESLVTELTMFEASDPRDTIYALMSLAYDTPGHLDYTRTKYRVTFEADYKKNILQVFKDFIAFCVHKSGSLNIICRKWAPNRRAKRLSVADRLKYRGRRPPTEEVRLPSWIGLLKESAFGIPRAGPKSRVAGDSLVDTPGTRPYEASGVRRAEVLFGEVGIGEAGDENSTELQNMNLASKPSTFKVTAEETLKRDRPYRSDGTLYVRGFRVDHIEQISHRLFEGLIPAEWLALAGWSETHDSQVSDIIPDQLWRTLVADRTPGGETPPGWYPVAMDWAIGRRNANGDIHTAELIRQGQPERMVEFLKRAQDVIWDKRFFLLSMPNAPHRFGLAPPKAQEGDIVCILLGCSVPVILRPVNEDYPNYGYEFIGEAYIYGMMEGEVLADYGDSSDGEIKKLSEEFCIV